MAQKIFHLVSVTLLGLILVFSVNPSLSQTIHRKPLVIDGGTLINGAGDESIVDSVIIIEGNRITYAGLREPAPIPPDANVINARGKWIIPGLIDMHVHLTPWKEIGLKLLLAYGVTSVRDMHGSAERLRDWQLATMTGERLGPRIFYSGSPLEGGPFAESTAVADNPRQARAKTHQLIDADAAATSDHRHPSGPTLKSITHTAQRDLSVFVHLESYTAREAIKYGIDGLEQWTSVTRDLIPEGYIPSEKIEFPLAELSRMTIRMLRGWTAADMNSPDARTLPKMIARQKVFFDPTLVQVYTLASMREATVAAAPALKYAPKELKRFWRRHNNTEGWRMLDFRIAEQALRKIQSFVGRIHQDGGRIIAGTDMGFPYVIPGASLHLELELLVQSGLSPKQAILAATRVASQALGAERSIGTIESGKLADLIILEADPLTNIRNTRRIYAVMKDGKLVDRQASLKK